MKNLNIRETKIAQLVNYPIQRVHIELTNACNFDCLFCPKAVMKRPVGFMKKELAFRIIDEISEQKIAEKVTFHIMGEPLLHPDFFEILNHCKKAGLNAGITTNGSFLKNETADKLVEANVHQINISLQTPDEKSFELRKAKNLNYNLYIENVVGYIRKLKSVSADTIVKIHFLNTKFNTSLSNEIGMTDIISDEITLRSVFTQWVEKIYSINEVAQSFDKKRVLREINNLKINKWHVLEIAPKIFFETYVLNSWGNAFSEKYVNAFMGYCTSMKDHFGILYNGDMVLCCKDFDGKTRVGNVQEKSIVDLLNSEMVLKIVSGFNKFKVVHSYCKRCLGGKSQSAAILNQLGSIIFMRLFKWYFYNSKKLYD